MEFDFTIVQALVNTFIREQVKLAEYSRHIQVCRDIPIIMENKSIVVVDAFIYNWLQIGKADVGVCEPECADAELDSRFLLAYGTQRPGPFQFVSL